MIYHDQLRWMCPVLYDNFISMLRFSVLQYVTMMVNQLHSSDEPVTICRQWAEDGSSAVAVHRWEIRILGSSQGVPRGLHGARDTNTTMCHQSKTRGWLISYKGYLMIKNRDLMGYNADEWIDIWNWSTFQPLAQVLQNSQWSQQHFLWTSNQRFLNFKQQALGLLISCCLMPCSALEHAHVATESELQEPHTKPPWAGHI